MHTPTKKPVNQSVRSARAAGRGGIAAGRGLAFAGAASPPCWPGAAL